MFKCHFQGYYVNEWIVAPVYVWFSQFEYKPEVSQQWIRRTQLCHSRKTMPLGLEIENATSDFKSERIEADFVSNK